MWRAALTLGRWLGPWTSDLRVPTGIERRRLSLGPFDAYRFRASRRPRGALLVVPGLHYDGPDDPRLDRFCRVLAAARMLVVCPFVPNLVGMRLGPAMIDDAERALDVLLDQPDYPRGRPPGVFSISFGSRAAIGVAGRRPEVGGLCLFGGYADFVETLRFSIQGDGPARAHDPLNQAVVFMNLVEHLEGAPPDPRELLDAWMRYLKLTWGREHLKHGDQRFEIADDLAATLPAAQRELFLLGTGARAGGIDVALDALARSGDAFDYLDPLPDCPAVRCPTTVAHGREDDVIPWEHAPRLADAIPGARLHLTGIYAHTGQSGLQSASQALDEGTAMLGILRGIASTGQGPDPVREQSVPKTALISGN